MEVLTVKKWVYPDIYLYYFGFCYNEESLRNFEAVPRALVSNQMLFKAFFAAQIADYGIMRLFPFHSSVRL